MSATNENTTIQLEAPPAGLEVADERRWLAPLNDADLRDDGEDGITFIGHAAVFDRLSEDLGGFKERIQRGAFRKVLDRAPDVRFLLNHDENHVMARTRSGTMELSEDPRGLRVYAKLAPTQAAKDLRVLVKRGDIDQMSFGFSMRDGGRDVWTEEDGGVVRTIVAFGGLLDVSAVTFPAYPQTDATVRSVAGVDLYADGRLDLDALRAVALRAHRGEIELTSGDLAAIDAAFATTQTVSPWIAERALRAVSQEPELRAAITGNDDTADDDSPTQGLGLAAAMVRIASRERSPHGGR